MVDRMGELPAEVVEFISLAAIGALAIWLIPTFLCHRRVLMAAKPGQLGELKRALRWSRFEEAQSLVQPAGRGALATLRTLQTVGYGLILVLLAVMFVVVAFRGS